MNASVERRQARQRVLKEAKIVSLNHTSILDCRVRDLSASGAKLICAVPLSVPEEFRFWLTGDQSIRPAKVMWRRGENIGIQFLGPPAPAPKAWFKG